MSSNRQLFLQHVAQTSPSPIGLEISRAEGVYMFDADGKAYIDMISGFSVMNVGHGLPQVKEAINRQVNDYMHLMVYGELIESPQVQYARLLTQWLPPALDCVYFTNSGTEATEGAMKLAKRITHRSKIMAANKAYHGSTQGALSIMGSEYWRNAYRPLLPDVHHYDFNSEAFLHAVDEQTACVVIEVVQAEAGAMAAQHDWLLALRRQCDAVGAMLVFDEIQTGFGRTGTLFAFEAYGVVPDILLLGKALGGGMPLGAFVASHAHMQLLTHNPVLGHISTFAGHPVCCAAGMASFQYLVHLMQANRLMDQVNRKATLFRHHLQHPAIQSVHHAGLLMAVALADAETCVAVCKACVAAGVITDWFLFAPHCLRIAPPLIMPDDVIETACKLILQAIEDHS